MKRSGKLTDNELTEFAFEFRKVILNGKSSKMMCAVISWPLAGMLNFHGIECECVESDLGDCNHIWIRLADGRALDATADQFNEVFNLNYPPVYLGDLLNIHQ